MGHEGPAVCARIPAICQTYIGPCQGGPAATAFFNPAYITPHDQTDTEALHACQVHEHLGHEFRPDLSRIQAPDPVNPVFTSSEHVMSYQYSDSYPCSVLHIAPISHQTLAAHTTSRNMHTPASTHLIQLCLLFNCAVNTSSLNLASVVYTGHAYVSFVSLSAVTALTRITGMGQKSSFGLESSSTPALSSQRAPSSVRPVMNAPSLQ
eukprot:GHUV01028839.1.p1 GENE.GHUV01028839.1~~GHUV01028839.1.p1  ORF type:complete len:208 (-),score=14.75 GHUV01028839.1:51-674(-)